jgi:putative tricarboxylic transport membrane protein
MRKRGRRSVYGGSTTAILLNIPGEVASVPTCWDGYPMAQQGRGGVALGVAAIGSFIAGTFGVIALTLFAPVLADQALRFGPPEYFALMMLAFTAVVSLSGASLSRGIAMALVGYLLSLVGLGPATAQPRFTFGSENLYGGVDLIAVIVGLFAISEVFLGIEEARVAIAEKITNIFPSRADLRQSLPAMEKNLIQALSMSGGSLLIFVQRGLTLTLLVAALMLVILSLWLMRATVRRVELAAAEGADLS